MTMKTRYKIQIFHTGKSREGICIFALYAQHLHSALECTTCIVIDGVLIQC